MVAVVIHLAARRTEEAAMRGKQAAEKASDAKTRLLAMVSHDLRGPLNPILMAVAVAESDPVVAERVLLAVGSDEEIDDIEGRASFQTQRFLLAALIADASPNAQQLDDFMLRARRLADRWLA